MDEQRTADHLPDAVVAFCRSEGLGTVTAIEAIQGGLISKVMRIATTEVGKLILKEDPNAPPAMFVREGEGLDALREAASLTVPRVYLVGPHFLLLEDLGSSTPKPGYWSDFGRRLALQHRRTNPFFGFASDNYLGRLPQRNPWTVDGHDFFARHRVLRYLEEPLCQALFAPTELARIARFAERLRQLVPVQPAALLHGDLWKANMMIGPLGEPAVIDPAPYYGWPEAELSMVRQYPGVPEEFFDAYIEVNPLAEGWRERLEILSIRELLAMTAHVGDTYGTVEKVRALLAKYG